MSGEHDSHQQHLMRELRSSARFAIISHDAVKFALCNPEAFIMFARKTQPDAYRRLEDDRIINQLQLTAAHNKRTAVIFQEELRRRGNLP